MVLLAMIRREWIHAVLRIARQGYYFAVGGRGQWRTTEFGGSRRLIAAANRGSACCRMRAPAMNPQTKSTELREKTFRTQLLAWYDAHARDLPWRQRPRATKPRDPYRVWLSEIMLQQTRVAAVIAHYHEFLRRFPTVEKLARAREASVLAAWSGLGYYRRARMLHAAAKVVVREGGRFPATAERLRALPGVGRYTAAAIASIAFGEPVAVVDGNVERVLQRVSGRRLAGEEFWRAAEGVLDRGRPGDFNQAMMELGATVCTPRAPACLTCPVVELCATRGELAGSGKVVRQKRREIHYALDLRDDAVFLVQRARDARLMAGMWELPEMVGPVLGARKQQVPPARFASRRNDNQNESDSPAWFTLRHSITVTDYTVRVWRTTAAASVRGEWVAVGRLARVALTGLARKILRKAEIIAAHPKGARRHLS
jgi:A/G-specific adenine glycosylase